MATMSKAGLLEVKKWVTENNAHNSSMKFFLDIREDMLIGIVVVFFSVKKRIKDEVKDEIYGRIRLLSNHRLCPVKDDGLNHGVLKIDVNYIHRRCTPNNVIMALNYIRNEMPKIIQGK